MNRVRYGAKTPEEMRNRELEATTVDVWTTSLAVHYETDPEALAAVLPPFLVPSDRPLVRISFASVDIGRGRPKFGAGTFAVQCVHDGPDGRTVGNYPLLMPMTTEQAVVGGRETYGEPKKLASVGLELDGDQVHAWFERLGFRIVEVLGTRGAQVEPPGTERRTDFYLKFLMNPSGTGFDSDPSLVYCYREEKTRTLWSVDGTLTLKDSPFDPVADLPVVSVVDMTVGERSSVQRGVIVGTVPPEQVLPYVHQRYDDLSVTG